MPYDVHMEKLKAICEGGNPSISELAGVLGVAPPTVAEWCNGRRPVPVRRCRAIEEATGGRITRRDLRPDDWQDIWPELAESEPKPTPAPAHQARVAINYEAMEAAHGY